MTVPVAAVVLLKHEEALIAQFRAQGACSRETAMTTRALSVSEDRTFRRLRDRAVIREGAPGTFYCDEATVVARRGTRRRVLTVVLLLAASVAIVLLAQLRRGAPL